LHFLAELSEPLGSLAEIAVGLEGEKYAFLLDSAAPDSKLSRYSFLAVRPRYVVRTWRRGRSARVRIEFPGRPGETRKFEVVDPFNLLGRLVRGARGDAFGGYSAGEPCSSLPFIGGLIGYVGYEMLHFVERVPEGPTRDLDLPEMLLADCSMSVAFDRDTGEAFLSVIGRGFDAASARADAEHLLTELREVVALGRAEAGQSRDGHVVAPGGPALVEELPGAPEDGEWIASLSESDYLRAIDRIKEHIAAGDLYEMNLTRRVSRCFRGRPQELYRHLRGSNPAPFGAYFKLPEVSIISCSPERFLRMDHRGKVETRPIKGTRPRGRDGIEDRRLAAELFDSGKDRAEHIMIVDLLRNDLGRVCEFGSVRVPEVMNVERHPTVLQMVSRVVGRLRSGLDAADLLRATFPGGSMTGAPKVAAMQLISRLEPVARGIYSGCLGYFDVRGGCDLSMVIRTALVSEGMVHVHSGGAIVADSDPLAESEEASLKADALVRAVEEVAPAGRSAMPVS
jgi:para-aminobenzoate synthetase component 1